MSENLSESYIDVLSFLPSNIACEIGRITIAFSAMEDAFSVLIRSLLGVGPSTAQAVIFKIRNLTDRIDLARTLVRLRLKDFSETLETIARVERNNERRNVLIHHALTQITFNIDPRAHEISFQKKDHRIRRAPVNTKMKGLEFTELVKEIRATTRKLESIAQVCKLELARGGPSP